MVLTLALEDVHFRDDEALVKGVLHFDNEVGRGEEGQDKEKGEEGVKWDVRDQIHQEGREKEYDQERL